MDGEWGDVCVCFVRSMFIIFWFCGQWDVTFHTPTKHITRTHTGGQGHARRPCAPVHGAERAALGVQGHFVGRADLLLVFLNRTDGEGGRLLVSPFWWRQVAAAAATFLLRALFEGEGAGLVM